MDNVILKKIDGIADPVIREGCRQAVEKTLLPALLEKIYPGHFTVTNDGKRFGLENTWPGLDSWEISGAYSAIGLNDVQKNYFDYVKLSQRPDGNIPLAIYPVEILDFQHNRDTERRNIKYPDDVFSYNGRKWIGLFEHWQTVANPLSVLGPISFLLVGRELYDGLGKEWVKENFTYLQKCADYLCSRIEENGLMGGSGFYTEFPPRYGYDGVTQCYAIKVLRDFSSTCNDIGEEVWGDRYGAVSQKLRDVFESVFWRGDHYAEYVHKTHGLIDKRAFSDTNLAAVGLNIATDGQAETIWKKYKTVEGMNYSGFPTQAVAYPFYYEEFELNELDIPLQLQSHDRTYDVSAMGRVWYLELLSSKRMNDTKRYLESVGQVVEMGKRHDWLWYERYKVYDGKLVPCGPAGYCEYAAILIRAVFSIDKENFLGN